MSKNNELVSTTSQSLEMIDISLSKGSGDEAVLAELGHVQHMTRKFGFWSMLGLAFSITGTWVALSADLGAGLGNGGTTSLVWGTLIAGLSMYCVAASLGELLSCYPTSLGQAFFVLKLMPESSASRVMSYITGWINVAGWWTLIASCATFTTSFFVVIIQILAPDYEVKSWHESLIFEVTIWAYAFFNVTLTRYDRFLPWFNTISLITNIMLGWPDGFAFLQGLLSATYGFTALDSVIHMVEELPKPGRNGPKTMVAAVWLGIVTGFIFLVVIFACAQSMDQLLHTHLGIPFAQILYNVTGKTGAATLMILLQLNTVISALSITTAASRLTFGFARDNGLPFSDFFSHVSSIWLMPVRATIGQTCVVSIIGLFYLFANDVLWAVISLSSITLVLSCAVPVAVLLYVGRSRMPADRPYNLGKKGLLYNIIGVAFTAVISVVFFFPGNPDPSARDMNWAIVPFGALALLAVISWFMGANRRYGVIPTTADLY